jgi:hypothetical protein
VSVRRAVSGLLVLVFAYTVARAAGSIAWRTQTLYGVGVQMRYPVVLGTEAARLNPVIERWMGASCRRSPMIRNTNLGHTTYRDARACVLALSKRCAAWQGASGPSLLATAPCQAKITATIELNKEGLLALELDSYGSTNYNAMAVARPGWDIEYLNLDVRTGRALGLSDLLNLSSRNAAALERAVQGSLRAALRIPSSETLMQAGFSANRPPIASKVEVLGQGLLFRYGPTELRFPVGAAPQVVVPYEALSRLMRHGGALARLVSPALSR